MQLNLYPGQVPRLYPIPPTFASLACAIPSILLKASRNKVHIASRFCMDVKLMVCNSICCVLQKLRTIPLTTQLVDTRTT